MHCKKDTRQSSDSDRQRISRTVNYKIISFLPVSNISYVLLPTFIDVAGLVFPIHLFQPLILNGRYVSDQKSLPDEALVFLSAATEYFTAELLEIASRIVSSLLLISFTVNHTTHHNHRETNLNAHHIKEALPSDEELSHLLSQYSVSSDIQKAWKSKVHEILE